MKRHNNIEAWFEWDHCCSVCVCVWGWVEMTADRSEWFVHTHARTLLRKHTHTNTGAKTAGPAKVILSLCVRQRDLLADSDILLFPHTAQTDNTTHQHRPWCMLNSCSSSAEERLTSPAAVSNKQTTISETHCQNRQINRTQRDINRQLHKSPYTVRNVSPRNLSQKCVALPYNHNVWTKHTQIISQEQQVRDGSKCYWCVNWSLLQWSFI